MSEFWKHSCHCIYNLFTSESIHTWRQILQSSLTLSIVMKVLFLMFTGCSEWALQLTDCCLRSSLCSGLTDGLLHALGDQWHPNPHSHSSLALGSTAAAQTINIPSYRLISLPSIHSINVHIHNSINVHSAYLPLDILQESKAILVLNYSPNHKDIWETRSTTSHLFNLSTQWKEWSVSHSSLFSSRVRAPSIIWPGVWVSHRTSLDIVAEKSQSLLGIENIIHPSANHYTD
jgi:hypothetical protein